MPREKVSAAQRAFGQAVGKRMKDLRVAKNLSGEQLARQSDVSLDSIRSIESGRVSSPGLYAITKIARALGTPIDQMTPSLTAAKDE